MMDGRGQLTWVHRNRTKRVRALPLGDVVQRLACGLDTAESGLLPNVAVAVDEIVDDAFRACCRVLSLHNGIVRIGVSEAMSVAWIRRQWRLPLQELMRTRFRGSNIRDVRFVRDSDRADRDVVV